MAEDDGRPPPIDTPEHRARLSARKGHAAGAWIRDRPHPDEVNHPIEPPPADAGTLALQVEALTDMVHGLHSTFGKLEIGANAAAPPRPDAWKWIAGLGGVVTVCISMFGAAQNVVSSNQSAAATVQKNTDKMESIDERLRVVEKRQTDNIPRLDAQVTENRMQNDRINAIVESLADERRARQADQIESRKAQQDIMALIARYADKLADIDKAVAVMQAGGGRRSDIPGPPEHDAQLRPR